MKICSVCRAMLKNEISVKNIKSEEGSRRAEKRWDNELNEKI